MYVVRYHCSQHHLRQSLGYGLSDWLTSANLSPSVIADADLGHDSSAGSLHSEPRYFLDDFDGDVNHAGAPASDFGRQAVIAFVGVVGHNRSPSSGFGRERVSRELAMAFSSGVMGCTPDLQRVDILLEPDDLAISEAPDMRELRVHLFSRRGIGANRSAQGDNDIARAEQFVGRRRIVHPIGYQSAKDALSHSGRRPVWIAISVEEILRFVSENLSIHLRQGRCTISPLECRIEPLDDRNIFLGLRTCIVI